MRGWCTKHYRRVLLYGDPMTVMNGRGLSLLEKFTLRYVVDERTGCWLWTRGINHQGYGTFAVAHGVSRGAHRMAYQLLIGSIPDGYTVDHICHNADTACPGGPTCLHRRCVNPAHLEAVTMQVNVLRGNTRSAANARKTHCPKGHPYDAANTYMTRSRTRACRACRKERQQRRDGTYREPVGSAGGGNRSSSSTSIPQVSLSGMD